MFKVNVNFIKLKKKEKEKENENFIQACVFCCLASHV